jgi:thiol-disulfide isomerase/thioredoxin
MRKLITLAAAAASLLTLSLNAGTAPAAPKAPVVPRKAAEFVFNMVEGPTQLLSMYKGKTIVLALMFTTCPHCQKTAQLLTNIQSEFAPKGVQVLGAVFDKGAAGRAKLFSKQLGLNFPVGYSEQGPVLDFLQLPQTDPYFVPILVFIDKLGVIRSQYIGDESFLSKQELNIRAEIDKLLGTAPAALNYPTTIPTSKSNSKR